MACLSKLAPQFIEENRLCWLRSPLFIVEKGKNRSYYFTNEEFNKAKELGEIKGEVHRAKGLGALEPHEAHESMFTDKFQRMDIMEFSDKGLRLLYDLMGVDIGLRKDFIFKNVDFSEVKE